ncbi:zinc finger protein ZAT5-like [Bidens hawaiensis]|uniref:zinc finger protein ZAT5-like n=1 Tax=Bidens hawaiensis TaxID=980011 RepID=UPI0040490EE8
MEMEFMAEFTEGMSRDIARQIIKGKRTKRHRPSSPLVDGGDCFIDSFDEAKLVSTKEDEDMANCLIMLARSVSPVTEEKYSGQKTEKLSCRRLTEINGVKSGLYAYECKTCNRTFPSFQALGGHRASHKKPKVNVDEKISSSVNYNNNNTNNNIIITQPQPPLMEYIEEDNDVEVDEENKASIINNTNNVQNGTNMMINHNNTTTKGGGKVHECLICGSEFLSGQALGGHMTKHRPIPHTGNRTTGISTTTDDTTADQITEKSPSNMLSLDLNFPPPEVVEDHFSQQQQQRMVFSAPAFVDCHY